MCAPWTYHQVEHDKILLSHFLDGLFSNKCLLQLCGNISVYLV